LIVVTLPQIPSFQLMKDAGLSVTQLEMLCYTFLAQLNLLMVQDHCVPCPLQPLVQKHHPDDSATFSDYSKNTAISINQHRGFHGTVASPCDIE